MTSLAHDSNRDQISQNRAMVYDPNRDLVMLILGTGGDDGQAVVYAMKYRHHQARFVR